METVLASAQGARDKPAKKMPDIRRARARFNQLQEARRQYEQRWKSIRDYQLPWIGHFDDTADDTEPARRRDLKTMTNVPWTAAQTFAAGVMSGLTPPSRQWFKFGFDNSAFAEDVEALQVLDQRQEIVSAYLSKSNFYNAIFQIYMELPVGQSPLGIFKASDGLRFYQYQVGTYYLGTSASGQVDTFGRKYKLTAAQLAEQFGEDNLPESILNMLKTSAKYDKKFDVYWLVEPNNDKEPDGFGNTQMPWRSMYWLGNSTNEKNGGFLEVGGFLEFPTPVARYQVTGNESYAIGPAWYAEGDAKQLNVLKEDYLRAVELSVKPPLKSPASVYNKGISLKPGGVTIADEQAGSNTVEPLFNVNTNLQYLQQEIMRIEESIKRTYSADLFLLLDGIDRGQMTAREVMERQQEKLQQLGPVVERLQFEFLSPALTRVYNILDRAGIFPEIPPEIAERIAEAEVKIEYISPLAQAQKMSGLVNIEQGISFVAQLAQLDPQVLLTTDFMGAVRKYYDMLGAPAVMRRSEEETNELIAQQQQAQQQQEAAAQTMAAMQAAAPAAQAAKNLTEAANDGNPALAQWLGMEEI